MPTISNMTVIVAYDVEADGTRTELFDYLTDTLGAHQRTESVYEFVYSPPPDFAHILRRIRSIIEPDAGDEVFVWDLDNGKLRRVAVHKLKSA